MGKREGRWISTLEATTKRRDPKVIDVDERKGRREGKKRTRRCSAKKARARASGQQMEGKEVMMY